MGGEEGEKVHFTGKGLNHYIPHTYKLKGPHSVPHDIEEKYSSVLLILEENEIHTAIQFIRRGIKHYIPHTYKHKGLHSIPQDVGEKGSSVSLIHEEDEIRTAIRVLVRSMVSACTQPQPLKRLVMGWKYSLM